MEAFWALAKRTTMFTALLMTLLICGCGKWQDAFVSEDISEISSQYHLEASGKTEENTSKEGQTVNVKQNFTLLGNDFFTLYGKQFFTSSGKEFFT